jgi:hypothetical protein
MIKCMRIFCIKHIVLKEKKIMINACSRDSKSRSLIINDEFIF